MYVTLKNTFFFFLSHFKFFSDLINPEKACKYFFKSNRTKSILVCFHFYKPKTNLYNNQIKIWSIDTGLILPKSNKHLFFCNFNDEISSLLFSITVAQNLFSATNSAHIIGMYHVEFTVFYSKYFDMFKYLSKENSFDMPVTK